MGLSSRSTTTGSLRQRAQYHRASSGLWAANVISQVRESAEGAVLDPVFYMVCDVCL
jgi:hypothetical protein